MRYEDWNFLEAEVRLSEHRKLGQVLGFVSVPDFTTLYRFLQRPMTRPLTARLAKRCVDSVIRGRALSILTVTANGQQWHAFCESEIISFRFSENAKGLTAENNEEIEQIYLDERIQLIFCELTRGFAGYPIFTGS